VTVDGEGKTRVRDRYVVATPVAGRLRRITLRRGDAVEEGQLIEQVDPLPLTPLDPRQRAEAIGRVNAAEDAKRKIYRIVERNRATYEQARRDLERSASRLCSDLTTRVRYPTPRNIRSARSLSAETYPASA
jgi:HlyD family secretion protein